MMTHEPEQEHEMANKPAATTDHPHEAPTGDAAAVQTPAATASNSPRVLQVGDHFPWEYRDKVEHEGKDIERKTACIATIARLASGVVFANLTLPEGVDDAKALAIGWPRRVHILNADAAKALGIPSPPSEAPAAEQK